MTTETELRRLVELAAKAMGVEVRYWDSFPILIRADTGEYWNPHTDDGDSARMRSALKIDVSWSVYFVECSSNYAWKREHFGHHNDDRNAALRLCALWTAAAIGENMK